MRSSTRCVSAFCSSVQRLHLLAVAVFEPAVGVGDRVPEDLLDEVVAPGGDRQRTGEPWVHRCENFGEGIGHHGSFGGRLGWRRRPRAARGQEDASQRNEPLAKLPHPQMVTRARRYVKGPARYLGGVGIAPFGRGRRSLFRVLGTIVYLVITRARLAQGHDEIRRCPSSGPPFGTRGRRDRGCARFPKRPANPAVSTC